MLRFVIVSAIDSIHIVSYGVVISMVIDLAFKKLFVERK